MKIHYNVNNNIVTSMIESNNIHSLRSVYLL